MTSSSIVGSCEEPDQMPDPKIGGGMNGGDFGAFSMDVSTARNSGWKHECSRSLFLLVLARALASWR